MRRCRVLVIGLCALTALVGAFSAAGGVTAQTATPTATAPSTPTPTATAAPQPDLVAILRSQLDARNRGDIATAASQFTDDAVQVGGGGANLCAGASPCVGKAAVQRQIENAVANHIQLTIVGSPQVSGNVVTVRVELRNDGTRAAGVDRIISLMAWTFRGDKISRLTQEQDLTDAQTAAFVATQARPRPPATGSFGIAGVADSATPARWLIGAMVAATSILVVGARTATAHRR